MSAEAWRLDATALAEAFAAGRLDPLAVAREMLARIGRIGPALNAFAALDPRFEREAAESAARWRAGAPRGPLEGVPIVVKDNLRAAGMAAAWGNAALSGRVAETDEAPVARLRAAGALVLGKGTTPEFAVEGYTASARFGVTRNPFDPRLTPGGSSGGVVAAVAAGLGAAGLGTDGGGSIRRPAAYCGLVGLKPGIARVARAEGLPQVLLDFETVGPLTRSVRDAALIDGVLAGPDRRDPRSRARPPTPDWGEAPRVLYVPILGDAPCDPAILAATDAAAARLGRLGARVTRGALPLDLAPLNAAWGRIAEIGLARLFEADPEVAAAAAPKYREMADRGARAPATELWAILETVEALRRAAGALFAEWDVVMTPACAAPPWEADRPYPETIAGAAVGPRGHAIYTGWVNAAGLPALALPAAPGEGAPPVGLQLVGDLGSEPALLALGARVEAAGPGFVWPALAGREGGGHSAHGG